VTPLAVNGMGAITAVGGNVPLSVASIYTSGHRLEELAVEGSDGEKVVGAPTMIGAELQGADRLRVLGMLALQECGARMGGARLPVVVLAPALEVYGRDAGWLLRRILDDTELPLDGDASCVLAVGRGGESQALALVGRLLLSDAWPSCLLLAVDSLVVAARLAREVATGRVAGGANPTGFVPGEAGAALLLSLRADAACAGVIAGAGHCEGGADYVTSAAVLVEAADRALGDAHVRARALSAVCHDGPGDWAQLEELALADGRPPLSLAPHAQRFIPAISTGEVGAASGILSLVTLSFLLTKGVLRSPALAMFTSDGAARGAAVLVPAGARAPRGVNDGQ
jgi:3-oxoacyl-[acyl-carrier-protein] synthase-1